MPRTFHVVCDLKVGRCLRTRVGLADKRCLERTFRSIEAGTARMRQVGNEPGLFRVIDCNHQLFLSARAGSRQVEVLDIVPLRPLP